MFDELSSRLERIDSHLNVADYVSLQYAALECRLCLEEIAYEFLVASQKYVSRREIRQWQPGKMMKKLEELVDPRIAQGKKLAISKNPMSGPHLEQGEFEELEYVDIAEQPNIHVAKFGKLWNALSQHLHVHQSARNSGSAEELIQAISKKIREARSFVSEFEESKSVLLITSETFSFTCLCGIKNTRAVVKGMEKLVISCINPDCAENWTTLDGCELERLVVSVNCSQCDFEMIWPESKLTKLQLNRVYASKCPECQFKNSVKWQLAIANVA